MAASGPHSHSGQIQRLLSPVIQNWVCQSLPHSLPFLVFERTVWFELCLPSSVSSSINSYVFSFQECLQIDEHLHSAMQYNVRCDIIDLFLISFFN